MKKRLICAALIIAIMLGGCGLGSKLTAFGLYSKAVSDIKKAGGLEAECVITADLGIASMETTMHMKQSGDVSETVMYVGGEEVSRALTYEGYVYTLTADGSKTKEKVDESKIEAVDGIPKLAEELFDGVEVIETETGKAVTVSVGGDVLGDLMGSADEMSSIEFSDAVLTMNFNEDNEIQNMLMTADISVALPIAGAEMSLDAKMTADYRFINLGEKPEIEVPGDLGEYVTAEAD